MTIKVYGLKNCDSTRKAVKLLKESGNPAEIHDLRIDGVPPKLLKEWLKVIGSETLLNKRGTTWRGLPDNVKEGLTPGKIEKLLKEHPALIKRPILDQGDGFTCGLKDLKSG